MSNSFVLYPLRACFVLCWSGLGWFAALAVGAEAADPLSSRVSAFTAQGESRLTALVRFARQNKIALGIESSTADLDRIVTIHTQSTDARNAITMILGNSRGYSLSALEGLVSIRDSDVLPPSWLDHKIRRFRLQRTAVAFAFTSLWMTIARELDPLTKGLAGDSTPGDPRDQVGPLDVRGTTIRFLLDRLAASSARTTWMVTRPGARLLPPAVINQYFTVMYQADPISQLPGVAVPRLKIP